jgi:acetyltransferase
VTREEMAFSGEQAVEIAEKLGYPVALKISSPQITHKSEAGGVQLNLTSELEVKKAYGEIWKRCREYNPDAEIEGVLIQEMVGEGVEVIIGMSKDPTFGPTIMFGLGGIFVEILKDLTLRVLPITRRDAEEMIKEIKGYEILKGTRGGLRRDIDAIVDLLLKVSRLTIDWEECISEIDLNPVIVFSDGKGAKAVDSLIIKVADSSTQLKNKNK